MQWNAEKRLACLRPTHHRPEIIFKMSGDEDESGWRSEMCVSVVDASLFPVLADILLENQYLSEIECECEDRRSCTRLCICYLIINRILIESNTFAEYENGQELNAEMWKMSLFYCAYTNHRDDVPSNERKLFRGSGKTMFQNTVSKLSPLPVIIEAEAGIHKMKEEHKLYLLYREMGFTLIGPLSDTYSEELWDQRIEDNEDNSVLGHDKKEQISNLKWSSCLMIRHPH